MLTTRSIRAARQKTRADIAEAADLITRVGDGSQHAIPIERHLRALPVRSDKRCDGTRAIPLDNRSDGVPIDDRGEEEVCIVDEPKQRVGRDRIKCEEMPSG